LPAELACREQNVVRTDVFIFNSEFDEEVLQLACVVSFKHPVGCLVLRKDWMVVSVKMVPIDFCQDQYVNYFIQHIIDKMGPGKINNTYVDLRGKILDPSTSTAL
jgi:hypothetical protein